jgi:hypothetical protein
MTVAGSGIKSAMAAHSQDMASPNAMTTARAAITPGAAPSGPVADDDAEDYHDGHGEQVTGGVAEQAAEHERAAPHGQGAEAVEHPGRHVLG